MGWTDSAVRRFVRDAGDLLDELIELTRCDCTTRNERKAAQLAPAHGRARGAHRRAARPRRSCGRSGPTSTATQVMEHLGIAPGPVVGEALAFLLELRLDEGPLGEDEARRRLVRGGPSALRPAPDPNFRRSRAVGARSSAPWGSTWPRSRSRTSTCSSRSSGRWRRTGRRTSRPWAREEVALRFFRPAASKPQRVWLARLDGAPAGRVVLRSPQGTNAHQVMAVMAVAPAARGRGSGGACSPPRSAAAGPDRRILTIEADPGPASAWCERLGLTPRQTVRYSRLTLPDIDPALLGSWSDPVKAVDAGYRLVAWRGPHPPDLVPLACEALASMADAPLDGLDYETRRPRRRSPMNRLRPSPVGWSLSARWWWPPTGAPPASRSWPCTGTGRPSAVRATRWWWLPTGPRPGQMAQGGQPAGRPRRVPRADVGHDHQRRDQSVDAGHQRGHGLPPPPGHPHPPGAVGHRR